METLHILYKIRWQIELVFKTWKSIVSIHKIKSAKIERLMCEVYGKLIIAAISTMIVAAVESKYNDIVVSLHRTMRHLRAVALFMASAIMQGGTVLDTFIGKQINQIARFCAKHKQKNKPTIEMLLQADPFTKTQKFQQPTCLA